MEAFQGLAGKTIVLTINSKPEKTGSRDILIKPEDGEQKLLRYRAWIESNPKKLMQQPMVKLVISMSPAPV